GLPIRYVLFLRYVRLLQGVENRQEWPDALKRIIHGVMETPTLQALIGQEVLAFIPHIDPKVFQTVKLLAIEDGGLWIECEKLTQLILQSARLPAAKTPAFFFPYSQITFLMVPVEQIALSESALGVE